MNKEKEKIISRRIVYYTTLQRLNENSFGASRITELHQTSTFSVNTSTQDFSRGQSIKVPYAIHI